MEKSYGISGLVGGGGGGSPENTLKQTALAMLCDDITSAENRALEMANRIARFADIFHGPRPEAVNGASTPQAPNENLRLRVNRLNDALALLEGRVSELTR